MKTTRYFEHMRKRPDRAEIREEWILAAVDEPIEEQVQSDGRVRRWKWVDEKGRFLRVILMADRETVHNAFFDRRFEPKVKK